MKERRDDTTKPEAESRPAREPGSYYYDDATGYETYSPGEDEDEPGGAGPDAAEGELRRGATPEPGGGGGCAPPRA